MIQTTSRMLPGALCALALAPPALAQSTFPNKPIGKLGLKDKP